MSSHSRSKTQSHIDLASANINASSSTTTIVNGQQFCFVEPPSTQPTEIQQPELYFSAPLTEPRKAHHRNLTEQVRPAKDLPPLVTKAAVRSPNATFKNVSMASCQQACQLYRSPDQSRQTSPVRTDQVSPSIDSKEKKAKSSDKAGKLANWFKGESEPIALGILPSPTKETPDPFDVSNTSSEVRPSSLLQRTSTAIASSKPAMASRLSFLTGKGNSTKPARQSIDLDDELINMDISKALRPMRPSDPLSPSAVRDLQQQAESLLLRLQAAYKERTVSLRDVAAEKEALSEETEGAETKARHLKTQLDDMSTKLAEQDEAMMNLVDELAQEKLARREEEEARKRSVRLVEHNTPPSARSRGASLSNATSDSGFESEDDSAAESVFSRRNGAHSPAMSMSSVSTTNSPDAYHASDFHVSALSRTQSSRLRGFPVHVGKGISLSLQDNIAEEPIRSVCKNCNGTQASEAWNVVHMLQEENKCIKYRVGELEGALDGCLALVNGLS